MGRSPNYAHWLRQTLWSTEEAAELLHGVNPHHVVVGDEELLEEAVAANEPDYISPITTTATALERAVIAEDLKAARQDGTTYVRPVDAVAWAVKEKYELATELTQYLADRRHSAVEDQAAPNHGPPYAVAYTHQGKEARPLTREEYEQLVGESARFELMVDAVGHPRCVVRWSSKDDDTLTSGELALLRHFLVRRAGTDPYVRLVRRPGVSSTDEGMRTHLKRLRKKLGHDLFDMRRPPTEYCLAPPQSLKFCIVVRPTSSARAE